MTTATQTTKPARSFRFLTAFAGNKASIRITQARGNRVESVDYDVTLTPVGGAVAVEFKKPFVDLDSRMRSDRYVCLVQAGQPTVCECCGYLRYSSCKHSSLSPVLVLQCAKAVARG